MQYIGQSLKLKGRSTNCMTGLQTSRSWHSVTHWPKCETDALVGILPNRLANIEMQTIADTLAQVLVR